MKSFTLILSVVCLSVCSSRLQAQTHTQLSNTTWKWYFEPLHDTLTMYIGTDTIFTTSGTGNMVAKSVSKLYNDSLHIKDVSGMYVCQDGEGIYRLTLEGDYLIFALVNDNCPNRADALNGCKMKRYYP